MNHQTGFSSSLLALSARFFCYFLVGSITLSAFNLYYQYQRFQLEKEERQHEDFLRLNLAAETLARDLQTIVSDLRWLSHSQVLQDYLAESNPINSARLKTDLRDFAKYTALYDQVRYIDAEGLERVRINFNDGEPSVVSDAELQDKSHRYYFREAIKLPRNKIYFSPLDLNIENREIERPYKPMIRAAIALYDNNDENPNGIVILNYLARHLLNHFGNVMKDSWGKAMLLNQEGYWLYSTDTRDEWGFMWNNDRTFAKRCPMAWRQISKSLSGTVVTDEGLFNYVTLSPLTHEGLNDAVAEYSSHVWKIVTHVSPDALTLQPWRQLWRNDPKQWFMLIIIAAFSIVTAILRQNQILHGKALEASEIRYRNILNNMAEGYILQEAVYDSDKKPYDYRFLDANPAAERLLHVKRDELIGQALSEVFPHTETHWLDAFAQVAVTGKALRLIQYGQAFGCYFEITASSPELGHVAVFFSDVTERKKAEDRLRQDATVFSNTQEAIIITDADQQIVRVNEAYSKITGFSSEDAIGNNPRLHQSGQHDNAFYGALWNSLDIKGRWQGEIWNRRKSGEMFPAWESITAIRDEGGKIIYYVAIMSDITPIKQAEEKLEYLAHHDALTGLPNRLMLEMTLNKILQRAQRHQQRLALLFLDLNGFKPINDRFGHAMGDHLLQVIAERLKTSVRGADIASRIGGDEFILVFDELTETNGACILAERVALVVAEPVQLNDHEVSVSASIGISVFPDDAKTVDGLIKAADAAMYEAKADNDSFRFFSNRPSGG
ncbi:MAG: diguanylate cyclase domain-containing protein [Gammaproteobacteria bacterium]